MQRKKQNATTVGPSELWLAAVAHELKNPIQGMGNALHLLEGTQLDALARTYLGIAKEELAHMKELVGNLLNRTRPEPDETSGVVLCEVLDAALDFYAHKIAFKKVDVVKRYSTPGSISALPGDMRQVFRNLTVNALEALPLDGGRLTVRISRLRDWKYPESRGKIRVTIADNGSGIMPQNLKKIFSGRFTTKGAKGNGVGLWIAKRLVEDLGGSIRVRSNATLGRSWTCFNVFLPIRHPKQQYEVPQAAA